MKDNAGDEPVPPQTAMTPATRAAQAPAEFVPQNEDERLAYHMVKSGFFPDARQVSQAIVKILLGRSLGIGPVASMTGIYKNAQNKLCMTANLMATVIQISKRYRFQVDLKNHTNKQCPIEYFEREPGQPWQSLGVYITRLEEFEHLVKGPNAASWKNYPKNMLFARNITNASKFTCAGAFGGQVFYLPDEIPNSGFIVDGETLEVVAAPFSLSTPSPASSPNDVRHNDVQDAEAVVASSSSGTLQEKVQAQMKEHGLNEEWLHNAVGRGCLAKALTPEEATKALKFLSLRRKPTA